MKLDNIIESIKSAGFSHIKVELEADLGRGDEDSEDECYECEGSGEQYCGECSGEGYYFDTSTDDEGDEIETREECDECGTSGRVECDSCYGEPYSNGGTEWTVDWCADFIREHVSTEAWDSLNYSLFYRDGSVDSEFTFTLPVEQIKYIPEFITAFENISIDTGHIDVGGAGMHISVLNDSNYPYGQKALVPVKLNNFKREVSKLLPSLFFLASADYKSRSLEYRNPRVADNDKYVAIYTHGGTCFEYRLFETCYERPEAIFEYLDVVSKTLEYYRDARKRVPVLNKNFAFSRGEGIGRFFQTIDAMEVLEAQLKTLGLSKSIRKLKQQRNVPTSKTEIRKRQSKRKAKLVNDFRSLIDQEHQTSGYNIENLIRQATRDTEVLINV